MAANATTKFNGTADLVSRARRALPPMGSPCTLAWMQLSGREGVKSIARAISIVLVLPALCSYNVRRLFMGADRALMGSSQALSLVPGLLGQYVRTAFLRCVLARCAASATIE